MEVILLVDVPQLGAKNTVIKVSSGYARNYLLPRGLAIEASKQNRTKLEQQQTSSQLKVDKELQKAKGIAQQLQQKKIKVQARAGDGGRLFGSITNQDITKTIESIFKIALDKRKVYLPQPIKSLGNFPVEIRLHPEVHITLTVDVVAE